MIVYVLHMTNRYGRGVHIQGVYSEKEIMFSKIPNNMKEISDARQGEPYYYYEDYELDAQ